MTKYKCPTLGDCDRANKGEIFERGPGDDLSCPACGTLLVAQGGPSSPTSAKGSKTPMLAIGGLAVIALLAGGGYMAMRKPANQSEVSAAAVAVAPLAQAAPSAIGGGGIAPSEADTQALKQQSEAQLKAGAAGVAELAANSAAANELMKSAIAKLAQGKLQEAERDLLAARERDPKQPLVYYNTAVLRLRQDRKDDALKSLEACFMAGFTQFDQMDRDTDLNGLRQDQKFVELVARYQKPRT